MMLGGSVMAILIKSLEISRGKKKIIDHFDLEASSGEIIGLIAPNGTGKTTLFNGIAHLIPLKYNQLTLNGNSSSNRVAFNNSFFFLESSQSLYAEMTPLDHLKMIKNNWNSAYDEQSVINHLKMNDYKKIPTKKLSLGMRQHVLIAMYVMSDVPIMLMDEPLIGLDPSSISTVNQIISDWGKQGKALIISSHDLYNIKESCNRVIFLKDKKIAAQTRNLEKIQSMYQQLYE